MTLIYRCDNCGAEFEEAYEDLQALLWRWNDAEEDLIGHYCSKCQEKIEARIKEGIQ